MLKGLSGNSPAGLLAVFVFLLSAAGSALASAPLPLTPVDDLVEISYPSGARLDRATGNLNVPTRITNVSNRTLIGPLRLTLSNVDSSVTGPLNPDGVDVAGDPFFDVLGNGARLRPGLSADLLLRFTPTSRRSRLRFDTAVSANTLEVAPPGILPLGLPAANTTATLTVTAVVSNPEADPLTVTARRVGLNVGESAALNDSGADGDLAAGDGVYSGRLNVDYSGLGVGQCVRVAVTATSPQQSFTSATRSVCVTAVPIGAAGAVIEGRVPFALEPGGGEDAIAEAVGDEALVQMRNSDNPGFPEETLQSLGDTDFFDFEIVGFIPPFYQIRFNNPFDNADSFLGTLSELEGESEVVLAIPNFIASPLAFDPAASRESDPDTVQDGWERIRIGNAWNISRGLNTNIHVLDSGFDGTHDDLDGANINGDPDVNLNAAGHGTQVLGILAAEHANAVGISGVTRGAVVTATDFQAIPCSGVNAAICSINPSMGQLMAAIRAAYAAGAQIVSVQYGVPLAGGFTPAFMCPFIDQDLSDPTDKRLLIVSAGERDASGNPTNQFPAACNDSSFSGVPLAQPQRLIAVAATEPGTDALWNGNPFGYQQDVAAPGVNITTTEPCTTPGCANLVVNTGTSFAAPHVAGAAALLLSKGVDADDVEGLLRQTGAEIGETGLVRIDALAALQAANTPPNAVDDTAAAGEQQTIPIDLAQNDSDADDNADHPPELVLDSITITEPPQFGTLGAISNGVVDYTHSDGAAAGTTQIDSFSYEIFDTSGDSDTAVVEITVTLENDPPSILITDPVSGSTFDPGDSITFEASADDEESGDLSATIDWTSSIDGAFGTGASVTISTLSNGDHTITASVSDGVTTVEETILATVAADNPPNVQIISPPDGFTFTVGNAVGFAAEADDGDGNPLAPGSISWESSIDGALGTGPVITGLLSEGVHTITVSADDGVNPPATDTVSITIAPVDVPPTIAITAPLTGSAFSAGTAISFTGIASDPENGNLAGSIQWASSIDGPLGTGASIAFALSVGTHIITATVSDGVNPPETDFITVTVNPIGGGGLPTLTIGSPVDGTEFPVGTTVTFTAEAADSLGNDISDQIGWGAGGAGATIIGSPIGASIDVLFSQPGIGSVAAAVVEPGSSETASATRNVVITGVGAVPVLQVTEPPPNTPLAPDGSLTLIGTAADTEDGDISADIQWFAGPDLLGSGASLEIFGSQFPLGFQLITATVTDSDGNTNGSGTSIVVGNEPVVSITSPAPGEEVFFGDVTLFEATATDAEDGDVSANILWSSDIQGPLGSGAAIGASLIEATHVITATVFDSTGLQGGDEFIVTVQPPPPGGFGTATVDGEISVAEYGDAVQFNFDVQLPEGGTAAATMFVQNDFDNLYIGVAFDRAVLDAGGNAISVEFDVDNDREVSGGDDGLVFNPAIGFSDTVRVSSADNPAICAPANSPCSFRDVSVGGGNDGEGAFDFDGTAYNYELSHPLASGDANDFSLSVGDRLRFANLFIRLVSGSPNFDVGDTTLDDFLIISIVD